MTTFDDLLQELFEAERTARRLHDELATQGEEDRGEVMAAVRRGIETANAEEDEAEQAIRLSCLARLLGEFDGPDVADALIEILDSEHPDVRLEAGEQLQGLAFDRFKEVAQATERALAKMGTGSNALVELPLLLSEVPEGGVVRLLGQFLAHRDGDVVAAAIEALVEVGDPAVVAMLEDLVDDTRVSALEGMEDEEVTVGDLASDAIQILQPDD